MMSRISDNIKHIQSQLTTLCSPTHAVTLVCVSKGQPVESLQEVYNTGIRDFGESRLQEFQEKCDKLPSDIRWHFIGSLQLNKVRKVVGRFHLIHSVDSMKLLQKLSSISGELGITTSLLLQVNASQEISKHGFTKEELLVSFPSIIGLPYLEIKGLMAMAPAAKNASQELISKTFRDLAELRHRLESEFPICLAELSMGMSQDYALAVKEGATMVRIGSSIFL